MDSFIQQTLPIVSTAKATLILLLFLFLLIIITLHYSIGPGNKQPLISTLYLSTKPYPRSRLPPSIPGLPVIGNLYQYLRARRNPTAWLAFLTSLPPRTGEMTTLHLGSQTCVLLNNPRVAREIIAKHAAVTNERPAAPVAGDLISRGRRGTCRPTAEWVEARKVVHNVFNNGTLLQRDYGKWVEQESVMMLANYMFHPKQWYRHHYRYANSVIHRIVLGEGIRKESAELDELKRVTREFLANINGNLVDFFPDVVRLLPKWLQWWRPRWEEAGQKHLQAFRAWWVPVRKACEDGTAPPSFVKDVLLAKKTEYTGDDEDNMYLTMSVISAGSDSPRMAINTLVMAALVHPEMTVRARAEIDRICTDAGTGHNLKLPCVGDMPAMPYTCALLKEILRWRPPFPLVPPHQLTQDLDFEGYHFKAGTQFIINSVPVSREGGVEDSFSPERWIDGSETNIMQGLWSFGGGRKACLGYQLTQMDLFVAFARLLYCFDYAPVSRTLTDWEAVTNRRQAGHIDSERLNHHSTAEPFPVSVSVRSKDHERLIIEEASSLGYLDAAKAGS